MKFILGKKLGMTQVFREDGVVVPVTRVQAGPCVVTQIKTSGKDGFDAVQIGYGRQKLFRLSKAEQGHLRGIESVQPGIVLRFLRSMQADADHGLAKGDMFTVSIFEPGERVQVMGTSKGRGFQGVVKRHGFHGAPATHGHKDQERMPGSIGATDAARVFKGTRMGGHMGDSQVTVKNLEVVEVHPDSNEILIKGAVPGARNGLIVISTQEGKIEIESPKITETEDAAAASSDGDVITAGEETEEAKETKDTAKTHDVEITEDAAAADGKAAQDEKQEKQES